MQLKTIFTVNYLYAFLFGAGFVFLPKLCSSLVGFEVAGDAPLIARCMGLFVICTGVLTFLARDAEKSAARRAIVVSMFVLFILLAVFKVLMNLVWGIPLGPMLVLIYVLHALFIVTYGYHLFGRPREIDS
jgi:hypothetical protein